MFIDIYILELENHRCYINKHQYFIWKSSANIQLYYTNYLVIGRYFIIFISKVI